MAKLGTVRPCEREKTKFEAVAADGTVNPYAFRTEAEALASLPDEPEKTVEDREYSPRKKHS